MPASDLRHERTLFGSSDGCGASASEEGCKRLSGGSEKYVESAEVTGHGDVHDWGVGVCQACYRRASEAKLDDEVDELAGLDTGQGGRGPGFAGARWAYTPIVSTAIGWPPESVMVGSLRSSMR